MIFTLPPVPVELTQAADRVEYVVRHYWDSVEWGSVSEADTPIIEGAFADYATVLPLLPEGERGEVLSAWLEDVGHGSAEVLDMVKRIGRLYLYQYDSPVYNTELYLDFAEAVSLLDPGDVRMSSDATALAVGRPGSEAVDVRLVDSIGTETTLLGLVTEGSEAGTLVIFYAPDCRDCHDLRDQLKDRGGDESVVAVYAGDDIERWRIDLDGWPAGWTVTRALDGEDIPYLIRRTPTVYVISKEGGVLRREL